VPVYLPLPRFLVVVGISFGYVVLMAWFLSTTGVYRAFNVSVRQPRVVYPVVFLGGGGAAGLVLSNYLPGALALEYGEFFPHIVEGGALVRGLAWVVGILIALALVQAFFMYAPLPSVTLKGEDTKKGRLVARADGVWYFFDDTGELQAVSNDKVYEARGYSTD
jgi:hypothetical protein